KLSDTDELIIASHEQVCSEEQQSELSALLRSDTALQREFAYFGAAKLQADMRIVFPQKEKLKKSAVIVYLTSAYSYYAAAAILALIVLVINPFKKDFKTEGANHLAFAQPAKLNRSNEVFVIAEKTKAVSNNSLKNKREISCDNRALTNQVQNAMIENLTNEQNVVSNINKSPIVGQTERCSEKVNINYYEIEELDLPAVVSIQKQNGIIAKLENNLWQNEDELHSESKPGKRMNLLALLSNGLRKIGFKQSGARKVYNEEEDVIEYNVNLAGIIISKKDHN
ncbi:MAG: hypothetical protein ACK4UV_09655, partial [Ignavibacterium sp.]